MLHDYPVSFYDSLSRSKITFEPLQENQASLYVCGPTVYDTPHIGNARSIIFFDVVYRLLSLKFTTVKYVRNVTDVDDKIITAAKSLGKSPLEVSSQFFEEFSTISNDLCCKSPTSEPKVSEYIPEIITYIQNLIHLGKAYIAENEVFFDVSTFAEYGKLSNRKPSEMIAGVRIENSSGKKSVADFTLWKPSKEGEFGFESPFGYGRPGWHIECSVMSTQILGENFDIHGGGVDLIFPHHENEIAQSCSSSSSCGFAKYWIHNGMLTVDGKKMSKSVGNFITLKDLFEKGYDPRLVRLAILTGHYTKPLNFSYDLLDRLKSTLIKFDKFYDNITDLLDKTHPDLVDKEFGGLLTQDFNTPKLIAYMHLLIKDYKQTENEENKLKYGLRFATSYNVIIPRSN